MNILFDYFLFHFHSVFNAAGISVSYGTDATANICISKATTWFFDHLQPYPEKVTWKEWKGKVIPFFFEEEDSGQALLVQSADQVLVTADIVASAFYLLSGWQEFYSSERDQFGRFPYSASMQARHNFVALPVVNYYFDILKSAIELATGKPVTRLLWPENTFSVCLSHDIDRCESGWKIAGKEALKRKNFPELLRLLLAKARGKDSWFNLSEIAALEEKHGARSTWFFLSENRSYHGHPNADYDISLHKYQQLIKGLQQRGHEVAVHGSFGSNSNAPQLQSEIAKIGVPVKGNRFHYLQYLPETTPAVLETAETSWDASLGFAEHFGFRNSFCHPFRPFNFKTRRMSSFAELPLNLMDTTLRHPNYLWLEPDQILPAVEPMLQQIVKFNGCFSLLWHNEHFTGYHLPNDEQVYEQLLLWCKQKDAVFLTCSEAAKGLAE